MADTSKKAEEKAPVEEHKGASDGVDMDEVRTALKAYDSYDVSPLAIDRTDDDKLAADYKLLVDAGSIAPKGQSDKETDKKRQAFEDQQVGGPVNES